MKKNFKIAGAITAVVAIAATLIITHYSRKPSKEITRAQLFEAIDKTAIAKATAVPSFYDGIYTIEGTLKAGGKEKPFAVTTHLTDAQLASLFGQTAVKVDVPGRGGGQWEIVVSTLIIAAVISFLFMHQMNLGKLKTSHRVQERPDVRFADVAGIEEAKAEVQEVVDFLRN